MPHRLTKQEQRIIEKSKQEYSRHGGAGTTDWRRWLLSILLFALFFLVMVIVCVSVFGTVR